MDLKRWYIYKTEYYSAVKNNDIVKFLTNERKWRKKTSEVAQPKKENMIGAYPKCNQRGFIQHLMETGADPQPHNRQKLGNPAEERKIGL